MFNNISRKLFYLWDNTEKYGRARQTKDGNMRLACCITKATAHTQNICLFLFHGNGYANAPQYYVYIHIACLVLILFYPCFPFVSLFISLLLIYTLPSFNSFSSPFLFLLAVISFLPLSCLPPELLGSRKTSFLNMFLVLKLSCLSLADVIRSVTLAWSLICLQTAAFPSTQPMAGQLPAHPSCNLARVLIPSEITNTSEITKTFNWDNTVPRSKTVKSLARTWQSIVWKQVSRVTR